MSRHRRLIMLSLALLSAPAFAAEPQQVANRLLDHLQAGQIADAEAMLTTQMAEAVPADKLGALWKSLGDLQERGAPEVSTQQGMHLVVVPLKFASGRVNAQVAVDAQDKVAGLMLRPAAADKAPPPPADARYSEVDFSVPQARGALSGTLALPKGEGPFPAVVLVHGSGPQDRDETIGGSRPFLDVARGLAAQGIAVLRYDKRTFARPQDFANDRFTVDDETTLDAEAALASLAADPRVDRKRVFVMGHSQGGMLAPRIASRWPQARGAILWAAPARTLLELLPEQNRYLMALDGSISAPEQAFLDRLDAQIAAARSDIPAPASELPLGVPQSFWKSVEAVNARADAQALHKPLLMLHGGRDFQVPDADWVLWQKALAGRGDVQWQAYPALNHIGIAGSGPSSLQEYAQPGHVDATLIDDVATWIKAQR
ncbi:alpha/beta fold hydrolase [Stenotrophomonas sp. GD03701]|nr:MULTISPECIES: alpha/beta fold hydrolase [Stenotrophomonas]MDH1388728.1 alpha/beta fold hydrolase [Stenotrophomonas sp. GD03701]MDH1393247.1 alpha/beta fold hydrolase [Stenotrophomonas sp. GD03702]MDQ7301609.1 alpha/beta fold hydrolase [Stenotrophomonas sp. Sm0581]